MDHNRPAYRLGIDLGGTKLEGVLLDRHGQVCWSCRERTPAGDYAGTVAALAAMVAAARAQARALSGAPHLSVGVGTPGSAVGGLMKNCNSTCLNGRPLQADLQAAIGQPVRLTNDANCLALSEATDGAAAGAAVVFAAILGTGVGAGIAVHGHVLHGPNGLAGEWGHNPLPWADAADPAPPCYCGQVGCLETLLSGPGLAADHQRHTGQQLDAATVAAQAVAGDPAAQATLQRHAQRLARALAGVINLLDPDVIVLGGGLSRMAHLYREVPALWGRWVFAAGATEQPVHTRLLPALHGDASGVRGAAWLWPAAPTGT